jgi:hypothetical protein
VGISPTSNQGSCSPRFADRGDREGDTVHGDGALLGGVAGQPGRQAEPEPVPGAEVLPLTEHPEAVDVALDDVAVEAAAGGDAPFQVHGRAGGQGAGGGAAQRLAHHVDGHAGAVEPYGREADAVDGDGGTGGEVGSGVRRLEHEHGALPVGGGLQGDDAALL